MARYTDDQIQAYLDNVSGINRHEFESALASDADLRRRYENYKQLYNSLGSEKGFMLSAGFADSVMAEIETHESGATDKSDTTLILIAVIVSLATILYLFLPEVTQLAGFTQIYETFARIGQNLLPMLSAKSTNLLFMTMVILAVVSAMDKLIVGLRGKI